MAVSTVKPMSLSLSKQVGIFLSCSKCYFEIKHFFYVLFPYDESKYLVSTSFSSFAHFHSISGLVTISIQKILFTTDIAILLLS